MAVSRTALPNLATSGLAEIITENTAFTVPSIGAAAKQNVNMLLSSTGVAQVGDFAILLTDPIAVADGELVVRVNGPVAVADTIPLAVHNASAAAVAPAAVSGWQFLLIHNEGGGPRV